MYKHQLQGEASDCMRRKMKKNHENFSLSSIALGNIKELALVFCLILGVLLAPVSIATGDLCRKIGIKANKSNKN